MKSNYSKLVRLNPNEQAIIDLFRKEGETSILRELKNLLSKSGAASHDSPTIKKLIHLLDYPTFYSLKKLVDNNFMTKEDFYKLIEAMEKNKNILIVGPTGSGKSTLLRAILEYLLNKSPEQRLVILEVCRELCDESEDSNLLRQVHSLSMNEISFLQENGNPSHLCIGEITSTNDALALATGLNAGSQILTTLHGAEWETRLNYFVKGRAKKMFENTLSNHSFVIIKLDSFPQKRVTEVWEHQFQQL